MERKADSVPKSDSGCTWTQVTSLLPEALNWGHCHKSSTITILTFLRSGEDGLWTTLRMRLHETSMSFKNYKRGIIESRGTPSSSQNGLRQKGYNLCSGQRNQFRLREIRLRGTRKRKLTKWNVFVLNVSALRSEKCGSAGKYFYPFSLRFLYLRAKLQQPTNHRIKKQMTSSCGWIWRSQVTTGRVAFSEVSKRRLAGAPVSPTTFTPVCGKQQWGKTTGGERHDDFLPRNNEQSNGFGIVKAKMAQHWRRVLAQRPRTSPL